MKTTTEIHPSSNKKKSLTKRILLYGSILIVFIVVLGLFLAPGIVKDYINKHGKELAGRTIHIDKLHYNYFTSTLKVIGFTYFEQNDSDVFVGFDTLTVNMKPLKLLSDEIYIQQLHIINPNCKIIQNDSVFNFNDLIDFFAGTEASDTIVSNQPVSSFYKLILNDFIMKNGSFNYSDIVLNHPINLNNLTFIIPHIYWGEPDKSKANLTFNLANGGRVESDLDYNVDEGTFTGFAKIERLYLETFLPYIQQYFQVSDIDGFLSSELNFSGSSANYEDIKIDGNFVIDSLKLYDAQNRLVFGGVKSKAVLNTSEPLRYKVNVDLVQFDKPYIYFALIDSLTNFEKMMVSSTNETEPEDQGNDMEENTDEFTINQLVINDGLMDLSDQTMREEFNYELSEITVDMDTFSLQDDWVNFNANMKLNKRGTLEARLGVNPLDPMKRIELDYVLTDFQLPDINIYSKYYAGFPILFGDMYYLNKTKIINRQLESNNQLIIRNVEMGRKTGGIYDVPIKLALFILKDINGDINLDIPVRGDLSDPKISIGAIVWDTFKSFMFKIVASPFKALGNLLGADPKELEEITFNYSDTTLTGKQTRSFDLLLELEKKKPELLAELHYLNDKKLERTDAASELAKLLYFRKFGKKPNPNSKDYLQFLKEETGKDSLVIQDYELLIAPVSMTDSIIEKREKTRLDLTKKYFAEKNDSTLIRIFEYDKNEVLNIGSRPRFEVRYVLGEDAEEN